MKIRVGSRDSALAVKQSNIVIDLIKNLDSSIEVELITMKTTGDIILDRSLQKIGGKGLFVKELDTALMENRVDITVHSLKDMPMEENPDLPLLAFIKREDPFDALVLPEGKSEIDFSLPFGSSSSRRNLILSEIYPDANLESIRGNVGTRLKKLDDGQFSAIVLAAAGLRRLGLEDRISRKFTKDEMLPAAGQGIIVVQGRKGENYSFLDALDDKISRYSALAEREFVRYLDGGCTLPIGAFAEINGEDLSLTGLYYNENTKKYAKDTLNGTVYDGISIARTLAEKLKEETL